MSERKQDTSQRPAQIGVTADTRPCRRRPAVIRMLAAPAVLFILLLAGCGGTTVNSASNGTFTISPGSATIDTNCTGCNSKSSSGAPVELFTATMGSGGAATVTWSTTSGGDANSGRGTINATTGQYTPPGYLTANSVQVTITAKLTSDPSVTASTVVTITPGFLQPLSPENAALGANGTLALTGYIALAGGTTGINWALSNTATGSSGGQGTLGTPSCVRTTNSFTHCSVTYTAPSSISGTSSTYIVATVGTSTSKVASKILLNAAGVSSNPIAHEEQQTSAIMLGSSGGNNYDYDQKNGQITDCCGGTLGSLIKDTSGKQYILSNNHVLARSDQATVGETVVQPALIDDSCRPFGVTGAPIAPVGTLSAFLSLKSTTTNADAAIAEVNSGAVDSNGAILELGALQSDGTLLAAPPGVSSSAGKGKNAVLNMKVAKSGRTTGLTCATVSTVSLDVNVDYFSDCAESKSYVTKTYTNQIAISGNQFSDAGDSGSLVVDTADAEPVGLFFAGGVSTSGLSIGVANPAQDVLNELGSLRGTSYTFVGTNDHAVSCLNYGSSTAAAAQAVAITAAQASRAELAMNQARMLVSPSVGILGVATGKSLDQPGEAAVTIYVNQNMNVNVPATVNGVRTLVIPTTSTAVAFGVAPETPEEASVPAVLAPQVLSDAIASKALIARNLMKQNAAFFGVGIGQSLDNPKEAVLVIYVDRRNVPAQLQPTIDGMRTRYIIMDRLHVTRSYAQSIQSRSRCMPHPAPEQTDQNLLRTSSSLGLNF